MNLNSLTYLLAVVECGSISSAAEHLYISQPSLSRAIKRLEQDFGISILIRTQRGVELTEEGRDFVRSAQDVIASARAMENTFRQRKKRKHILTIASQPLDFLYEILLKIHNEFPKDSLCIDIQETDRGSVVEAVLNQEANIGLLVRSENKLRACHDLTLEKNLETHILGQSGYYLGMGPKSPFYNCQSVSWKELTGVESILFGSEQENRRRLLLGQEGEITALEPKVLCNTISACVPFLLNTNLHIATSKWVVQMFNDPVIRFIPIHPSPQHMSPSNELLWIKRSHEPLHKAEYEFLTLLIDCLSSQQL